ncbi:hypothetical protein [Pectobacterium carotovorum]|uniref:hypothetical protein n=1 Tax=Pectobacterium carotovorum TaxID=554 RepID=UPI002A83B3CF|nr:hypothetical protein [Pectobacterium carotovorum]MDY4374013.1 hypothetical protein [Pectobacterium carotovorum subsp. carotovorum]
MTGKETPEVAADEELPTKNAEGNNGGNYQPKPKRPYDKILTDLSEEDLRSPGVYKLILAKSSELEYENYELKKNDNKYRELEVKHASVAAELSHLKSGKKSIELLFSACLGTGTCLIGLSLSIYSATAPLGGYVIAGIGIALTGFSIAVTLLGKKNEV